MADALVGGGWPLRSPRCWSRCTVGDRHRVPAQAAWPRRQVMRFAVSHGAGSGITQDEISHTPGSVAARVRRIRWIPWPPHLYRVMGLGAETIIPDVMQDVAVTPPRERQDTDLSAIPTEYQGGAGTQDNARGCMADELFVFHHRPV